MKIIFKDLEPLELEINDQNNEQTVSSLKSIICSKHNIDNNINLIYCGQNLLNNRKLKDYQINNDSCIQTFIDCPTPEERDNTDIPQRNETRNVNTDNVNIMYEFSLGGSQTPRNTFSTDNNIQLSDIFSLFSNISRNNRSQRSSSRRRQSENNFFSGVRNNPDRDTQLNSENVNHSRGNNLSDNNPRELWRLLNNLNSQSHFNQLLNYLNDHGFDIPIDDLNSLIDNLNFRTENRLSVLSSLITIIKALSERTNSLTTETEISNNRQTEEGRDYSHLVSQIKDMGFFDEQLIIDTLTQSKGNINVTVETLLNKINNAR